MLERERLGAVDVLESSSRSTHAKKRKKINYKHLIEEGVQHSQKGEEDDFNPEIGTNFEGTQKALRENSVGTGHHRMIMSRK